MSFSTRSRRSIPLHLFLAIAAACSAGEAVAPRSAPPPANPTGELIISVEDRSAAAFAARAYGVEIDGIDARIPVGSEVRFPSLIPGGHDIELYRLDTQRSLDVTCQVTPGWRQKVQVSAGSAVSITFVITCTRTY